jgi:hypothetical protein
MLVVDGFFPDLLAGYGAAAFSAVAAKRQDH